MVILVMLFRVCLFLGFFFVFACLFFVGVWWGRGWCFFVVGVCVCFKMIWPTTNIVDRCYGIVSCVVCLSLY